MNSSVSSSCSDSDFLALGHVGNSTVSSIVNLQCHLTCLQVKHIYIISLVVTFILTVKSTDHAFTIV